MGSSERTCFLRAATCWGSSGIKDVAARVFQSLEIPPCKRKKGDAGGKLCFKTPQISFFHPLRWFVGRELKNKKKAAASDCLHAPLIVFTSSARPSLLAVIKSACWRGIGLNCKAGAWKSLGRPIGGVSEVFFFARHSCWFLHLRAY